MEHLCIEGIDNLREAIVEQAARDYLELRKMYHVIKRISDRPVALRKSILVKLGEVLKFFSSKWYRELCDLNAEELMEKLDDEVERWKGSPSEVEQFVKMRITEKKRKEGGLTGPLLFRGWEGSGRLMGSEWEGWLGQCTDVGW